VKARSSIDTANAEATILLLMVLPIAHGLSALRIQISIPRNIVMNLLKTGSSPDRFGCQHQGFEGKTGRVRLVRYGPQSTPLELGLASLLDG